MNFSAVALKEVIQKDGKKESPIRGEKGSNSAPLMMSLRKIGTNVNVKDRQQLFYL